MVQVPGSGSETHSVINPDGSTAPLVDMGQLSNGTPMLNPIQITAPAYQWVSLGGPNFATLGQMLGPYDPAAAFGQTLLFGMNGGAIAALPAKGIIGAVSGGYGGFKACGWQGVAPGVVAGVATSGAASLFLPELSGLAGIGTNLGTSTASAAVGALSVNAANNQPLGTGLGNAIAGGILAPLISGEALAVGGAGVGGAGVAGWADTSLNALSAAIGTLGP